MGDLLARRLAEDRPATGVWVTSRNPDLTEIIAASGVDWIVIDFEHSDLGFADVSDHLRAASRTEVTAIVRIPHLHRDAVQRSLDLGADGVMVPMAGDAETVSAALNFALYPPEGERGVSPARANLWGGYTDLEADLKQANERIFVIPMLETRAAAENVESMLSLPGLRAAFVGLADLSAQFGDVGGFGDSAPVKDAVERTLAVAREKGIAVGVMAVSAEDAKAKAAAGYRLLGVGSDIGLFGAGLSQAVGAIDAALERESPR